MRQTLTNDFWELHKNMNCTFPLKTSTSLNTFKHNIKQHYFNELKKKEP